MRNERSEPSLANDFLFAISKDKSEEANLPPILKTNSLIFDGMGYNATKASKPFLECTFGSLNVASKCASCQCLKPRQMVCYGIMEIAIKNMTFPVTTPKISKLVKIKKCHFSIYSTINFKG